ncbi:hypothetical protein SLEP1_g5252 [Rubroshorea leprosula]|uniref:Uncharacterized protein n=1 Tax=Rubroshorea leprosula TaxID=152421 RepID=A0AAV5I0A5_9ROSI|nr:hypothetical protein SLEP1_g5252 [Rubroshorea leprosula]
MVHTRSVRAGNSSLPLWQGQPPNNLPPLIPPQPPNNLPPHLATLAVLYFSFPALPSPSAAGHAASAKVSAPSGSP